MSDKNALWVERYRPQTLDDYIFHDENQKVTITSMLEEGSIPHLLFSGVAGSGKTTIALIIINQLEIEPVDLLSLNASDENSVDVMRDKIKGFISTYALGKFKVVHLEEADYLTPNAQAVLRRMMEDYADTARFILTCNLAHRIIAPLRSRCQEFKFVKHDVNDITELVANILIKEKVKFKLELLDTYVRIGYPDIRKIINLLQQNSKTGELIPQPKASGSDDYKFKLLECVERDDWVGARQICCSQVATDEWEEVYRFLYDSLDKSKKYKIQNNWESGINAIADHMTKHAISADPEINGASLFIKLGQIGR
jgi:DNA polymerase III delta prime subunit